ncbi:hypothetical protein BV22DRAFT_1044300 [Leucogyrophana mollusca]|uniref:Uncharacterized protein n=1 Tax=Leucogyrophana mollusca TaxID=85980 RepID=A0ACB8BVR7_9AGAM|nr:hypothetical protein BV22DRAFT_1044300 [Leucogyrophana mollusca]
MWYEDHNRIPDYYNAPFKLDISLDEEWAIWGADKSVYLESIRVVLTVTWLAEDSLVDLGNLKRRISVEGDVDHDHRWWMWGSRTHDLVFETGMNPMHPGNNGFCHYFGLVGRKDKSLQMYNFLVDNERDGTTYMSEVAFRREWI